MDLVITVRAVGHSSLTTVFRPLLATSAQVSRQIEAELARAGKGAARAAQEGSAAHKSAAAEQATSIRAIQALRNRDHREFLAGIREEAAEAKKAAREVGEERRRQAKSTADQERRGSGALRTFGSLARSGVGTLGRAASAGFGVDVDIFSAVGAARVTKDIAGRATRSAATAAGTTATQADIDETVKAIQQGGDRAKLGYQGMAEGLEDFVSKSADLKTGNAVLARMGIIAQATGADVKDLLSAAGDVNRELADGPDKAERLLSIMRLVAQQGAMGNVEVKDLARYMGRITASAFMYEGGKDKNIGILGALAQVSMKGGASSAAEATRSAAAFARDLTKDKSLKTFSDAEIDVFTDATNTKIRSPEAIIADVLAKSKGDIGELSKMFKNDASRKVLLGFANIYGEAGGGAKGLEAVKGEFKRYSATMSQGEMEAQARTALEGDTAAAQQFRNDLEKLGGQVQGELAPALRELAPVALSATRGLGSLVAFGASHPEAAITAAIVASIGKAAIGDTVGKAIAGQIGGGGGLVIGAAAIAVTAAVMQIMKYEDAAAAEHNKGADILGTTPELLKKAQDQLRTKGTVDKDTIDEIAKRRAELEGYRGVRTDKNDPTRYYGEKLDYTAAAFGGAEVGAGEGKNTFGKENAQGVEQLAAKMDAMIAAYKEAKIKGPIDVNIVGGATPGPAVNTGAQTGGVR